MRTTRRTMVLAGLAALVGLGLSAGPARAQGNTYADFPFNQGSLFYRPSGAYRPPQAARTMTAPAAAPTQYYYAPQGGAPTQYYYAPQGVVPTQYTYAQQQPTTTAPATVAPTQYYYVPQQGTTAAPTQYYYAPQQGAAAAPTQYYYAPQPQYPVRRGLFGRLRNY
jgi:hypothetical protein